MHVSSIILRCNALELYSRFYSGLDLYKNIVQKPIRTYFNHSFPSDQISLHLKWDLKNKAFA